VITLQTPAARSSDPITSDWAAESVQNTTAVQERILAILLREGPATDEAIARIYESWFPLPSQRATQQSLRTRRKELVDAGRVQFSGLYALTVSNRRAQEWVIV
jgi:hypothetical protein